MWQRSRHATRQGYFRALQASRINKGWFIHSLPLVRSFVAAAGKNSALTYGCLAGTSWFAVYGLTGGFHTSKSPNVSVGYDHYPVSEKVDHDS